MKNYYWFLCLGLAESVGMPALYFIKNDVFALYLGGIAFGIMLLEIYRIWAKGEKHGN